MQAKLGTGTTRVQPKVVLPYAHALLQTLRTLHVGLMLTLHNFSPQKRYWKRYSPNYDVGITKQRGAGEDDIPEADGPDTESTPLTCKGCSHVLFYTHPRGEFDQRQRDGRAARFWKAHYPWGRCPKSADQGPSPPSHAAPVPAPSPSVHQSLAPPAQLIAQKVQQASEFQCRVAAR